MKKRLFVMVAAFFAFAIGHSQSKFTGTVLDENQAPLPGASVVIKGSSNGTATDFDGNFEIELSDENRILMLSYIGYATKEFDTSGKTSASISLLLDSESLDEVVVTALGIERNQKKIGYTTQKMSAETINEVAVPNVGSLFTGQVAGLTVSNPTGLFQKAEMSLRGGSPIVVVDGIIVGTDFYSISPNDIADVNVLKGQTASALYGNRASTGAIIITTKRAKGEGLKIEVNHNTMISAGFTVFPEFQKEYGNGSNGKYEFWDGKDGGISDGDMIWGPKFEPGVMVPQWNSPIRDKVTGETTPWWGDVAGTRYDDKSKYERVATPWQYHDNLDNFMGTAVINSTDFAVSHNGEKGSVRLSVNYKNHKGRVPNSSLKTGGLTFNATTYLTDKLTLDSKLAYNKVYSPNYPRHGYGPRNHMYTLLVWMGDDVNGEDLKNHQYIPGQEGYRQANFNYAWYNNAYFAANELNQKYDRDQVNALMRLKYKFTENFNIQVRGSGRIDNRFEDRQSPKTYLNYGDPREGDYKTWNKKNLVVDYDFLANYKKDFSDDFKLDLNVGAASFYSKYQEEYNATDGLVVPWVYSLNNTAGNIKGNTNYREEATNGVYGSLSIDLFDAFYINLTGRNDWSSTLTKENRSFFYPSASMSTMVSNLIDMPEAIDFFKIKTSWAKVSGALSPYKTSAYYENNENFNGKVKLQYPNTLVNPNINPQSRATFEVGFNTALLNNKIGLDFTYYNELMTNNIIDLPISVASAFTGRKVNGNEFTRKGYEVILTAKPIQNQKFSWDILANWSTNTQRITKIYGNQPNYGSLQLNDRTDSYFTKTWETSSDGELVINTNGLPIRVNTKSKVGNKSPDWRLGLQNNFTIGKFQVNIGVDGAWGGLLRSKTVEKMWWGGKHPNSTKYRDAEYAAGAPVFVPKGVNVVSGEVKRDAFGKVTSDTRTYQPNSTAVNWQSWAQTYSYRAAVLQSDDAFFANIFDRSFFKLRTLSVKYDLTDDVNIKGLKSLTTTLSGYNLLVWKKADIVDPDFGNDDNLQDPSTRYIGIGVNAKF
ncbi:SusC/RagA family TonB-linked outer membrane protein [Maribacter sp.]|uniref:SusC/RagA family TonB-linked outer membrane protein n=1 Tax=Maribacter sp. TaxID=1897614 RepID=UPI0025BB1FA4|nr:SusC/RagA family TonB-linked outer membrane protein [Maribacter sp.]